MRQSEDRAVGAAPLTAAGNAAVERLSPEAYATLSAAVAVAEDSEDEDEGGGEGGEGGGGEGGGGEGGGGEGDGSPFTTTCEKLLHGVCEERCRNSQSFFPLRVDT